MLTWVWNQTQVGEKATAAFRGWQILVDVWWMWLDVCWWHDLLVGCVLCDFFFSGTGWADVCRSHPAQWGKYGRSARCWVPLLASCFEAKRIERMYMTSLLDVLLDPLPLCPPIFVWWMTRDNNPSQSCFLRSAEFRCVSTQVLRLRGVVPTLEAIFYT